MAYSRGDVQPPYTGGPTPARRPLTPRDFEVLDYNESLLTPRKQFLTYGLTATIQLARKRLRRSFDETSVSIELTVL